eukprot:8801037-Pyramimonas_sp.AAC.1
MNRCASLVEAAERVRSSGFEISSTRYYSEASSNSWQREALRVTSFTPRRNSCSSSITKNSTSYNLVREALRVTSFTPRPNFSSSSITKSSTW